MPKKLMKRLSVLDDNLSVAERVWSLIGLVAPMLSASLAAWWARGVTVLAPFGGLGYFTIFIAFWLAVTLAIYLMRRSERDQAHAEFLRTMSIPPTGINPLLSSFTDSIVRVSDLLTPGAPLHLHKHFQRCKIVGPGALNISGGTFKECIIDVPIIAVAAGTPTLGVPSLDHCILEECELIGLTILVDHQGGRGMAADGATVYG